MTEELTPDGELRRRTIRAVVGFGLAGLVPFGVWKWLKSSPTDAGIRQPLREVLRLNARVGSALFSPDHLAPTFPLAMAARNVRVNGREGLRSPVAGADTYAIRVEEPQPAGPPIRRELTMADIRALPHQELVFQFKCIEGWSQIQHWGGVRFADFVNRYVPRLSGPDAPYRYVGLETPDGGYYVGIDRASMLHPQTLLAFDMNGRPLTEPHGAPLRLIIPTKYGVKNLKRIGLIRFTSEPPRDYWAERGYDYYIGL